jgi:hypothetical protein
LSLSDSAATRSPITSFSKPWRSTCRAANARAPRRRRHSILGAWGLPTRSHSLACNCMASHSIPSIPSIPSAWPLLVDRSSHGHSAHTYHKTRHHLHITVVTCRGGLSCVYIVVSNPPPTFAVAAGRRRPKRAAALCGVLCAVGATGVPTSVIVSLRCRGRAR